MTTAPDLLFAGRLLRTNGDTGEIHMEKEAIRFLQQIADPITVVSIHGARGSGKTRLVHELAMRANEPNAELATGHAALPDTSSTSGVWIYVKKANYSDVKYIVFIDRQGFQGNEAAETLMYSILVGLSSMVVHHINGELTSDSLAAFSFLAPPDDVDPASSSFPSRYVFPHGPKLMWLLENVTTGDLKERATEKNVSSQEVEQNYLRTVLAAQPPENLAIRERLRTAFPDQTCFPLASRENEIVFAKRVDKLMRLLMESGRNRYLKSVQLNGPLFGSLLVSMLAHRDNIYQAFRGRVWKDIIHNCCLNIVESAIKMYKSRMAEQLAGIVDTSDLNDYTPLFPTQEKLPMIELPCESEVLESVHLAARRLSKRALRTMPVRSGKLNALLKKLFADLVDSLFSKIREENNRLSVDLCRALLKELHQDMTTQVECQLEIEGVEEGYAVQNSEFKRFFHNYQMLLFELMGEYTDRARGPVKKQQLSEFCQSTIRTQMADLTEALEKIRAHDVGTLEDTVEDSARKYEEANENQKLYHREAMSSQTDVNKKLVEVARIQAVREEVLGGAVDDLNAMHLMATKQKALLEEEAFVSVQLPSQKVLEAAKVKEVAQLQGYLIKQGGGSNAFNPLGRRNWKQRYFILNGDSLIYAKTKDDYERGRIIKELHVTGCRVEPSMDAGEGFEIIPPQSGTHVYELQRGIFEKNSKKRSSQADTGRTFKLRAQSIEERDNWIQKLRQSAGG